MKEGHGSSLGEALAVNAQNGVGHGVQDRVRNGFALLRLHDYDIGLVRVEDVALVSHKVLTTTVGGLLEI